MTNDIIVYQMTNRKLMVQHFWPKFNENTTLTILLIDTEIATKSFFLIWALSVSRLNSNCLLIFSIIQMIRLRHLIKATNLSDRCIFVPQFFYENTFTCCFHKLKWSLEYTVAWLLSWLVNSFISSLRWLKANLTTLLYLRQIKYHKTFSFASIFFLFSWLLFFLVIHLICILEWKR